MHFLLLTTSIVGDDLSKLQRMIDSLREYEGHESISISHVLLLQNVDEPRFAATVNTLTLPAWTHVMRSDRVLSLSAARNRMLQEAQQLALPDNTIVAFPDDDCWYPSGLLNRIAAQSSDFFFCRYATQTVPASATLMPTKATFKDIVFNASSNTIFLRKHVVDAVGLFNEQLGVGATYNGGEDLDYATRAFWQSHTVTFIPAPLVGHRDKMTAMRGNYFIGSALVLRNNAIKSAPAMFQFLRKLAVGTALVLKREMPLPTLLQVFSARLKEPAHGTQKH